jgi:TrmH family RNA methyltransferase
MRSVERLIAAARTDPDLVLLEGFHALKHAVRFGADVLAAVSADPERFATLAAELAPDVDFGAVERVPPALLGARPHHTQVLAVARRPAFDAAAIGPGRAVLLEDPRQLGNVGAVVRVAAAAGAAGVLTTGERDPWEPAALRGSAGLHFALPVGRGEPGDLPGRPLVAVDPGGAPFGALPSDAVLAFGTERHGLSEGLRARADARVAIPMRAGVSSLNLATAVAVVVYAGR